MLPYNCASLRPRKNGPMFLNNSFVATTKNLFNPRSWPRVSSVLRPLQGHTWESCQSKILSDRVLPDWSHIIFRVTISVDRRILCVLKERRSTDFKAPKLWKGRSGSRLCRTGLNPLGENLTFLGQLRSIKNQWMGFSVALALDSGSVSSSSACL